MNHTISVVVNTKNAASTLERCLKSVVSVATEIIVVDMGSTDATLTIAKKHDASIFSFKDVGYVEPARNFALSKASSEWVLLLDADEYIEKDLATHISSHLVESTTINCYFLPRKNFIFNKWIAHTGWWPDYQPRLFKTGSVNWQDTIHSHPVITGDSEHIVACENHAICHENYTSVEQFIDKLQRYTGITVDNSENKKQDTSQNTAITLIHAFKAEFLSRLHASNGIADGSHGVALSLLQSFYEVTVELKKWQHANFVDNKYNQLEVIQELDSLASDLKYWSADWHVRHSNGLQKIYWLTRRKLRI